MLEQRPSSEGEVSASDVFEHSVTPIVAGARFDRFNELAKLNQQRGMREIDCTLGERGALFLGN